MKTTFLIVFLLHMGVFFAGAYFYVIKPEAKKKAQPIIVVAKEKPKTVVKNVQRVPPRQVRKTTAMQPVKAVRDAGPEVIVSKHGSMPDFVVGLPEYQGDKVYRPDVAMLQLPDASLKESSRSSIWERELEFKEKEIVLEHFGISNLAPVGSAENPIASLQVEFTPIGDAGYQHQVGLYYPENVMIADNPKGQNINVTLGPYIVDLKDVVFWYLVKDTNQTYYSNDSCHCRVEYLGTETIRYTWEDLPNDCVYGNSSPDLQFTVTFVGMLR